jgi:phytoene synthase
MTPDPRLASAYAECERITREQARNFAWGIRLLPGPKRRALSAVYAAARRIDDIGDGNLPPAEKLTALARAREEVTLPAGHPDDPVLYALADAADRLPIPLPAFGELVDGCELDVTGQTVADPHDLVTYCRYVAGSIGRLSLGVFDPHLDAQDTVRASKLADSLGVALQMTNILRDVREDLQMGRVYLPAKDLELFGCQLRLDASGALDPQDGRLAELIRFEAARAWGWYDEGLKLLPLLDRRTRACCAAMAGIYSELLTRIARKPAMIFDQRASLPTREKLRVAAGALAASAARGAGGDHGR